MPYYHTKGYQPSTTDAVVSTSTDPLSFPLFSDSFARGSFAGQVDTALAIAISEPKQRDHLATDLVRGVELGFIHPVPLARKDKLLRLLELLDDPALEIAFKVYRKTLQADPSLVFSSSFLRGSPKGQLKSLAKKYPEGLPSNVHKALLEVIDGKELDSSDTALLARLTSNS